MFPLRKQTGRGIETAGGAVHRLLPDVPCAMNARRTPFGVFLVFQIADLSCETCDDGKLPAERRAKETKLYETKVKQTYGHR
jgi:hypothetical protein